MFVRSRRGPANARILARPGADAKTGSREEAIRVVSLMRLYRNPDRYS